MPKTAADARKKITVLTALPSNPEAPTVAELGDVDIQCNVLNSDFRLSATTSDTINEPAVCNESNATAWGRSNYEGNVTPFIYLDEQGKPVEAENYAFVAFNEKNASVLVAVRIGPRHDVAWAEGDEGWLWEVLPDNGQEPSDTSGYIKQTFPLAVQRRWKFTVAAA